MTLSMINDKIKNMKTCKILEAKTFGVRATNKLRCRVVYVCSIIIYCLFSINFWTCDEILEIFRRTLFNNIYLDK
jgi:hypothetical protein